MAKRPFGKFLCLDIHHIIRWLTIIDMSSTIPCTIITSLAKSIPSRFNHSNLIICCRIHNSYTISYLALTLSGLSSFWHRVSSNALLTPTQSCRLVCCPVHWRCVHHSQVLGAHQRFVKQNKEKELTNCGLLLHGPINLMIRAMAWDEC